jgi:hypothetical protein
MNNEFMLNPPSDPLANTCWVYAGNPNTPETQKWLDSLSKSEQFTLLGVYQGRMWTFKSNGIAWYGKDMIKTSDCSAKQNKLQGSITCPRSVWQYKFANSKVIYTKGTRESAWTAAWSRTDMCM